MMKSNGGLCFALPPLVTLPSLQHLHDLACNRFIEPAHEHTGKAQSLYDLLLVKRPEQLVRIRVANSPNRTHEEETKARLDVLASAAGEVSQADERIGVAESLTH